MSQEIEIEFKNLLTKDEYLKLKNTYTNHKMITQENHYFDTPFFHLKDMGSALRIREKSYGFQLTLKQPVKEGILETHQKLTPSEAKDMLENGGLIAGEVSDLLVKAGIPIQEIIHFGSLKTDRIEVPLGNNLLVLDHSKYLNKEDFEMEFEVKDRIEGESIFKKLLSNYKIPVRKTDNKIKRFYQEKIRQAT
ncbi:CYTH domain-containing protein [Jeotgalibacillus sp. S-D1]|uniref:CYTH domain-containing protein n=1 Tax=Jeotgalibacillus sp. S-D1 TaxID=2552189 RepID=UPI00105A614D|nr:CYTH domain-containing protein [Jeotgalibacillus sp. S-D1]TDL35307.1 CYTH domain-containing protein [Jeotgalibacillus sp. S-D1]